MPTRIEIGSSALERIVAGMSRVFIVTDEFLAQNNAVSYVSNRLDKMGITWECFSEIRADPDVEMVVAGVAKLKKFAPDAVVAFGGGSPIDAAKAMVYFAKNGLDMQKCKFIAIPTTSGTGTEVSRFAVITDEKKGIKYPMVDDSLIPDFAVIDATLTLSVPPQVTADTGMDVLTHAIEAYVSKNANPFTDAMAQRAVQISQKNIVIAYNEPENLVAREQMHYASCMAGIAFSGAGLGANHAMAHALGAMAKLPHGRANAILLPHIIAYNSGLNGVKMGEISTKYAQLAREMGDSASGDRQGTIALIRRINRLLRELKMPINIKSTGISESKFKEVLPKMTQAALADKCLETNPITASENDIVAIYKRAYGD